jgi:integrase
VRASTAVSLPGWLAAKMADYLGKVHPRAVDPNAPLWPAHAGNRVVGSGLQPAVR